MPQIDDNNKANNSQTTGRETERGNDRRDDRRETRRPQRRISSVLGMEGDTTRSATFNKLLSEITKDNSGDLIFGHVQDLRSASINYVGIDTEEKEKYAVAVIFENNDGGYRQDNNNKPVFTYDMLDEDFDILCREKIAEDLNCNEADVFLIDAQILNRDFNVTEDSVRHLTYSLATLAWNLSGAAEEEFDFGAYPNFVSTFKIQVGEIEETSTLHRADFKIDVNQMSGGNRKKFSRSLVKEGVETDAGRTEVFGFVGMDYIGPEKNPDEYEGDPAKFKPEQFAAKVQLNAVDTSASEEHIYERGLLALGAVYPIHSRNSWMDVLTQDLASDSSRSLAAVIDKMWLPVAIKAGKLDNANKIREQLEIAMTRETYVTVLHRDGETANGIIHCLAKIGGGDNDYLEALMAAGENLQKGFEQDLEKHLGVSDITCEDIVQNIVPHVFGTYKANGQIRTLEDFDLARVATIAGGDEEVYGEFLAATSLESREMNADSSKEFQIELLENVATSASIDGIGNEYQINPEFIEFLYKVIDDNFDEVEMAGYSDCRIREDRKQRVRGELRGSLRSQRSGRTFNDRSSRGFGRLSR